MNSAVHLWVCLFGEGRPGSIVRRPPCRCDECEVTEEDGKVKSTVWATEDLKLTGDIKLFGSWKGMPRNYGGSSVKGVMMASETYEKGSLVSRSEVTKVDLNATHSISLAGISMIRMDMVKRAQKNR